MPMRRVHLPRPPWHRVAPAVWPLTLATALAGCAGPDARSLAALAPHEQPTVAGVHRSVHALRPLSDTEGEVVVAAAIAAHEMRRP
jgi:hypothetical protein